MLAVHIDHIINKDSYAKHKKPNKGLKMCVADDAVYVITDANEGKQNKEKNQKGDKAENVEAWKITYIKRNTWICNKAVDLNGNKMTQKQKKKEEDKNSKST